MAERVDGLSGPQARRSSARQPIRLGLGIVTASKRVHDGCVDWLDVAVFCVPSPHEGRDTSCINARFLGSFFFFAVVIPARFFGTLLSADGEVRLCPYLHDYIYI